MEKLKALCRQGRFQVLLFLLGLVLLSWPFLTGAFMTGLGVTFVSLFLAGAVIIVLLFLVSSSPSVAASPTVDREVRISLTEKRALLRDLLAQYLPGMEAEALIQRCLSSAGIEGRNQIAVIEWAELVSQIETALADSIGATDAHSAMSRDALFTADETKQLSEAYGEILVSLRVSPRELQGRIDYYRERDTLLSHQAAELEAQIAERTQALERRTLQLEGAALVAREAAAIRDVPQLLDTTVRLISDRLGYYHAGIFLAGNGGETVILRAASSEGGQHMLARGHTLRVGKEGIVGHVAAAGEPRIAFDVGEDAVFFDNPDLPDTRSEAALPLMVQEQVIGVLDVQSKEEAAFSAEDVAILQTMADQVAMAIENARLVADTQAALAEIELVQQRYLSETWTHELGRRPEILGKYQSSEASELTAESATTEEDAVLAVPLRIGGLLLGTVEVRDRDGRRQWTDDDRALLEQVSEQMALAMETTRLFEETQRRAERERLIGEITAKIRASTDVQHILETAAMELGQALGTSRALVRLAPGDEVQRPSRGPVQSSGKPMAGESATEDGRG